MAGRRGKELMGISVLRKSDAKAFERFANYVWEGPEQTFFQIRNHATDKLLREKYGMDYRFYSFLQNLGFIDANSLLRVKMQAGESLCAFYAGTTYTLHTPQEEDIYVRM